MVAQPSAAEPGDCPAVDAQCWQQSTSCHVQSVRHVPGLYQLVVVKQEDQGHVFVAKPVPLVEQYEAFCNACLGGSFNRETRTVSFHELNNFLVTPIGLVGSNGDVWDELLRQGLDASRVQKEALKEGIVIWCPWLAHEAAQGSTGNPDEPGSVMPDVCMDEVYESTDDGWEDVGGEERRIFVCVWAGKEVASAAMHPPFNLCLRLLMELVNDVVFLVSPEAAAQLDPSKKPFQTGTGFSQKFHVQRRTASHTAVAVGAHSCYMLETPQELLSLQSAGCSIEHQGSSLHLAPAGVNLLSRFSVCGAEKKVEEKYLSRGISALKDKVMLSTDYVATIQRSVTAVSRMLHDGRCTEKSFHGALDSTELMTIFRTLLPERWQTLQRSLDYKGLLEAVHAAFELDDDVKQQLQRTIRRDLWLVANAMLQDAFGCSLSALQPDDSAAASSITPSAPPLSHDSLAHSAGQPDGKSAAQNKYAESTPYALRSLDPGNGSFGAKRERQQAAVVDSSAVGAHLPDVEMSSDGDWTEAGSAESKGALPRMAPSGPLFDAALRLPSSEVLAPVCLDEVELDGCSLLLEEEVYVRSLERVGFTRPP